MVEYNALVESLRAKNYELTNQERVAKAECERVDFDPFYKNKNEFYRQKRVKQRFRNRWKSWRPERLI